VYTTRPDTLFGATYMVLAPEHPLLAQVRARGCVCVCAHVLWVCLQKQSNSRDVCKPCMLF
jgi:leucyl-tRNA synthetase